jgi:hypothetical protein
MSLDADSPLALEVLPSNYTKLVPQTFQSLKEFVFAGLSLYHTWSAPRPLPGIPNMNIALNVQLLTASPPEARQLVQPIYFFSANSSTPCHLSLPSSDP